MTRYLNRAVALLRHPVHYARAALDTVAARPVLSAARRTWDQLQYEAQPVAELRAPSGRRLAPAADGVSLRLAGVVRRAIMVHAPTSLQWQTRTPNGGMVRVWCAIPPSHWAGDPQVRVTLRLRTDASETSTSVSLRPGHLWRHRRWTALNLAANGAVHATLDVEGGGTPMDVAIAQPEVRWRRSPAERHELRRAFFTRLRRGGVRDTVRWARQRERREDDAERYRQWCVRHTPGAGALDSMRRESHAWSSPPTFSVLTPVYNTDPSWLAACIASVRLQAYTQWELILSDDGSTREDTRALLQSLDDPRIHVVWNERNQGIAGATQAALACASGEFLALLDHDDALLPHAMYRVAEHLRRHPDADLIYSDEDKLELDGRRSDPYFKPDWAPDLFLSSMYVCHFLVLRRALVEQVGGFRPGFDGSQDYDLVLRVAEHTSRIHHIADVLYHWRKIPQSASSAGTAKPWAHLAGRRALQDYADRGVRGATVEDAGSPGLYRMHYALRDHPHVSVIIPECGGEADACRELLQHIERCSYAPREVVLVTDAAADPNGERETLAEGARGGRLRGIPAPKPHLPFVIEVEHSGSVTEQLNAGARAARGEYLLFLSPRVRPLHVDWIEALLEHAQRPGVGAVGAKLFYPDGRLRHIGLVRGPGGRALQPFDGYPGTWAGYFSNANCVRNCFAVSRSAMMTSRVIFEGMGGWRQSVAGEDIEIDLGARLLSAGARVVFTPYARFTDAAAATPGSCRPAWPSDSTGPDLPKDPFYNPHLAEDYSVRSG